MNQFDFGVKLPEVEPAPAQSFERQEMTKTTIERVLDPVRFASGQFQISDQYVRQLKDALNQLQGAVNLRIVLEGHTDNQALSSAGVARYGDNLGLSAARAGQSRPSSARHSGSRSISLLPKDMVIKGRLRVTTRRQGWP